MEQREQIIEAVLNQFLKHGIKQMTVQKLVEPMGLSTKTVYKYFEDKEELLKHCLLKHYSEMAKGIIDLDKAFSNPVLVLYNIWNDAISLDFGVNHLFYQDLNYYYPELQDSILKKVFRNMPSRLETSITRGIEDGYFRKDIDPVICMSVMELLYTSITRTERFKNYQVSTLVIMQNTMHAYLRGLCTEKGIKELNRNSQANKI
jgi:AcrR family transcriptional regulator